jgi:hypothetical protein
MAKGPRSTGRGRWAALSAALVLTACQAQAPSPSGPRGASAAPAATAEAPSASAIPSEPSAQRLDVTIERDAARTTTATIDSKGGSFELDLGGGTTATLVVPKYALIEPTQITMTAATVEDWPDAPPDLAAVQLEPDGLELFIPATLTFQRPDLGPDGSLGQIAWSGEGRALHAALGTRDGGGISLDVEHFSGYGLTWNIGTEEYWLSWRRVQAEAVQADMENTLAALIGWWRTQEMLGGEHNQLRDIVGPFVDTWYDSIYEPAMRAGETTCQGGRMALMVLNSMLRLFGKAGVPPEKLYRDFLDRRKPGESIQYAFDAMPPDYVTALSKRCDDEALEHCRATGDIELLAIYLRDRTKLVDLAGLDAADNGERLMEACGSYRLEADFTPGEDTTIYFENTTTPFFEKRKQWNLRVKVDLRWVPTEIGAPPWAGILAGEAKPAVQNLEWHERQRHVVGSDTGSKDEGWYPWCTRSATFGEWHSWPIWVRKLDFRRDRITNRYVLPMMEVALSPSFGVVLRERTVEVEGPLRTTSFISARVIFGELPGARESINGCGPGQGRDEMAYEVFDTFVVSQPKETNWAMYEEGLGEQELMLKDSDEHPFRAHREWSEVQVKQLSPSGPVKAEVRFDATVTLTHTPS